MDIAVLIEKTIEFDHGDPRRIHHFLKVHQFASLIGTMEKLPPPMLEILSAAAVLHDIGIHAAEEKYGSTAGKYQEQEGPAPARKILTALGCCTPFIDRVCFLIAHHHTYGQTDQPDYQILLEADFLVNAYEDNLSLRAIRTVRDRIFRTASGIALLNTLYEPAPSQDRIIPSASNNI